LDGDFECGYLLRRSTSFLVYNSQNSLINSFTSQQALIQILQNMPESRQKEIMEKMNELRNQHSLNDELSAEIYKQTQKADQCELENEQLREEITRLRTKAENLNREKAFIADSCEQTVMEIKSKLESVRQELLRTEHQFEEERLIRLVDDNSLTFHDIFFSEKN